MTNTKYTNRYILTNTTIVTDPTEYEKIAAEPSSMKGIRYINDSVVFSSSSLADVAQAVDRNFWDHSSKAASATVGMKAIIIPNKSQRTKFNTNFMVVGTITEITTGAAIWSSETE